MSKKPCLHCEQECDIFDAQIDLFSRVCLRVCDAQCLSHLMYEYLDEIGYRTKFKNKLYELEDSEDKKVREEENKARAELAAKNYEKNAAFNRALLTTPMPRSLHEVGGQKNVMTFKRPSKEKRIKFANQRIKNLMDDVELEKEELKKIEMEPE